MCSRAGITTSSAIFSVFILRRFHPFNAIYSAISRGGGIAKDGERFFGRYDALMMGHEVFTFLYTTWRERNRCSRWGGSLFRSCSFCLLVDVSIFRCDVSRFRCGVFGSTRDVFVGDSLSVVSVSL